MYFLETLKKFFPFTPYPDVTFIKSKGISFSHFESSLNAVSFFSISFTLKTLTFCISTKLKQHAVFEIQGNGTAHHTRPIPRQSTT